MLGILFFLFLHFLKSYEKRRAEEDRRIGTCRDAHEKRQDKVLSRLAAEYIENYERNKHGKRSVNGSGKGLADALPHDVIEGLL